MAFLHTHSCECIKSELDLFAVPSTQTSIETGQWIHYKPLSSLTDDNPIEFVVSGHGDEYIDLSQTMIHVTAKIVQSDGTNLTEDQIIGPINNWLHSLFSQVDIYLNQKLVSPPNSTYAYRSYIETLLNYGPHAKSSHLGCSLWYKDTAGKMNSTDQENKGFSERYKFVKNSKTVDMIGHLHGDIFNQEKFLLNGVELRLKLVRSRDEFCLLTSVNNLSAKIKITDASLLIRKQKINPTVLLAHSKALQLASAKYPITRVEVKVLTLPTGVQGKSMDNVFLGQLPKRCVIGFVSNKNFNGDIKCNPFNFENYKINFLSLYIDGRQIPSKPLQPSFNINNSLFVRMYQTLFSGTGIHFLNEGNDISREDYPKGYCLSAFDLTPDLSANLSTHWNLVRHGSLRVEVRFDEAIDETVNCIIYAEFDNLIEINKNREISIDFSN